jgi:hypothetical protein
MSQPNEENEAGMSSYSYYEEKFSRAKGNNQNIKAQQVSYGDASFRNFDLREVFIDSVPKGEYYVKIRNNDTKAIFKAVLFFTDKLHSCEVGVIDPGNELQLEFQIYIKTKDELLKEAMIPTMEKIDREIIMRVF